MRRDALSAMDPEDALTFLVGRAVRLSVILEHRTRLVWGSLVEDTVAEYAMPGGNRDMLAAVGRMLPHIGLRPDEVASCLEALKLTEQAHDARHRMAHEQWFPAVPESGDWTPVPRDIHVFLAKKQRVQPRSFEHFHGELRKLEDAIRRMSAMSLLVQMVFPSPMRKLLDPTEVPGDDDELRILCRQMLDGDSDTAPPVAVEVFSHVLRESVGLLEDLDDLHSSGADTSAR